MKQVKHRYLVGSPGHLRRILLNLISNALKYTQNKGCVQVEIAEISSDQKKVWLEFKVQDNGSGMSQEFVKHNLYKPFTQENDNVRTKYQGTGLGMSIVAEIVKVMQGSIKVESELGKGTTFVVMLSFGIGEQKAEINREENRKQG